MEDKDGEAKNDAPHSKVGTKEMPKKSVLSKNKRSSMAIGEKGKQERNKTP